MNGVMRISLPAFIRSSVSLCGNMKFCPDISTLTLSGSLYALSASNNDHVRPANDLTGTRSLNSRTHAGTSLR